MSALGFSQAPAHQTFSFSLEVTGFDLASDKYADALFEAGCSDGLVNTEGDRLFIDFDRSAASYEAAVDSAINDVRRAGGEVVQIKRLSPLVTE